MSFALYYNKFFDYLESKLFGSKEERRLKELERQAYLKEKEKQMVILGAEKAKMETEFITAKIKKRNELNLNNIGVVNNSKVAKKSIYSSFKEEDDKIKRMVDL